MTSQTRKTSVPQVTVGIMAAPVLHFTLHGIFLCGGCRVTGRQTATLSDGAISWCGHLQREFLFEPLSADASFTLSGVTIGISYHWERREDQTFRGSLKLIPETDGVRAVNVIDVEDYLVSVISSEMNATAGGAFLRASAIISRSWLLSQMEQHRHGKPKAPRSDAVGTSDGEVLTWTDRELHDHYDVCADDHCQRYQGITKAGHPNVARAVSDTRGQVLTYDGTICDARFSKCCGGVTEVFSTCWEDADVPYLRSVADTEPDLPAPDLSTEAAAERWIRSAPPAFCHTDDKDVLRLILNDFDRETNDFYRWRVSLSQEEVADLIHRKTGIDFGGIADLIPVARGRSGRLYKLKIVGTRRTLILGKELSIRRALSPSHLYSSAFIVEKGPLLDGLPSRFVLLGAGWGHGVGMCQIGAAVMGSRGYSYQQILHHYYKGAAITTLY